MGNLDDRPDVGEDRPRGAVGTHVQLRTHDLPHEPLHVLDDTRTRTGETDVRTLDAEIVDEVQDAELLVDRRRAHRRGLQPVAQRLVVQLDGGCGRLGRRDEIPVVHERVGHA